MKLFLCTAFTQTIVACFDEEKIHVYKKWKAESEAKEIPEVISTCNIHQLDGVLVSKGPGRFTSLRVGVACAQTISYVKNIPMYPFTTFQLFSSFECCEDVHFALQAGMKDIFFDGKLITFETLPKKSITWLGEVKTKHLLPNKWKETPMPEITVKMLNTLFSQAQKADHITIEYGKAPNISKKIF